MRRPAGWAVLSEIALEIAGLNLFLQVTTTPRESSTPAKPRRETIPNFITEVADADARHYRMRTTSGPLYAGFYSDGRVRITAPDGRRFSGVAVENKAVMAALRDDVSFEMEMIPAGSGAALKISGGPYDGQTLQGEAIG
ncbi:MAG: hypothetical protein JO177_00395 [Candidatus Eremiobacteraeota bacterium]|nr:hypothetical protein [Candidatus Eremiobacteraeota bacterium]